MLPGHHGAAGFGIYITEVYTYYRAIKGAAGLGIHVYN